MGMSDFAHEMGGSAHGRRLKGDLRLFKMIYDDYVSKSSSESCAM